MRREKENRRGEHKNVCVCIGKRNKGRSKNVYMYRERKRERERGERSKKKNLIPNGQIVIRARRVLAAAQRQRSVCERNVLNIKSATTGQ